MTDRTVIIPTPGSMQQPAQAPAASTQPSPAPDLGRVHEAIQVQSGLNPLVRAASTLLTLIIKLRTTTDYGNAPQLHQRITRELQKFDQEIKGQGVAQETVLASRYLLCTVLDETVMNTPWGAQSGWSQRSLLSIFHKETFGGEKCFLILQRLQETANQNLDVLELYYLCLSLGFEGKFRLAPNGHAQLETIRDNLYNTIQNHRGYVENDLSPRWEGKGRKANGLMHYIPLWVFAACTMALLMMTYAGFSVWLFQGNEPAIEMMQQLMSVMPAEITEP
ncbi:type IVB secretion system protein IcmH/DotU, partial [Endozoicomonas numazuensis]|uniref:type IVB secretion system protein IcmH/DotU n=1 Tax=Endozoicomonas numazuensis TaxID=1137799 RepID=UPI00055986ED